MDVMCIVYVWPLTQKIVTHGKSYDTRDKFSTFFKISRFLRSPGYMELSSYVTRGAVGLVGISGIWGNFGQSLFRNKVSSTER